MRFLIPVSTFEGWILTFTLKLFVGRLTLGMCLQSVGAPSVYLLLNDSFTFLQGSLPSLGYVWWPRSPHPQAPVLSLMLSCGQLEVPTNFIFDLMFCR